MVDESVAMNLKVLQGIDPYIVSIVVSTTQVSLYEFEQERLVWKKTDVEGTLFVYRREAEPLYGFIIINRLSRDNLVEVISKELNLKLETPFLLYKNSRGHINGIWFHLKEECEDVNKIIEGIIKEIKECDNNKNRGTVDMDRHRSHPVIEVNHTEFLPENMSKSEGVLLRLDELFKKADSEHKKMSSQLESELVGLNPERLESDSSLEENGIEVIKDCTKSTQIHNGGHLGELFKRAETEFNDRNKFKHTEINRLEANSVESNDIGANLLRLLRPREGKTVSPPPMSTNSSVQEFFAKYQTSSMTPGTHSVAPASVPPYMSRKDGSQAVDVLWDIQRQGGLRPPMSTTCYPAQESFLTNLIAGPQVHSVEAIESQLRKSDLGYSSKVTSNGVFHRRETGSKSRHSDHSQEDIGSYFLPVFSRSPTFGEGA